MACVLVLCGLLGLHLDHALAQQTNVFQYVDPLIGTGFGGLKQEKKGETRSYVDNRAGHVFAGATLPFGTSTHLSRRTRPQLTSPLRHGQSRCRCQW
jgi:hypothetical protein